MAGRGREFRIFPDLAYRVRAPEIMDDPAVEPPELRAALAHLRLGNIVLGTGRLVLGTIAGFARGWPPGAEVTVLDVGTGSADIPRRIAAWGRRRGYRIRALGVDLHPVTATEAARGSRRGAASVAVIRANALRLPLADRSVDYALASLFLHHLSDADAQALLAEMARVSRRGIVVQDMVRSRFSYGLIWLVTRFLPGRVSRYDGPVSVRQAFRPEEALAMARRAGIDWVTVRAYRAHRFVLSGERPGAWRYSGSIEKVSG